MPGLKKFKFFPELQVCQNLKQRIEFNDYVWQNMWHNLLKIHQRLAPQCKLSSFTVRVLIIV